MATDCRKSPASIVEESRVPEAGGQEGQGKTTEIFFALPRFLVFSFFLMLFLALFPLSGSTLETESLFLSRQL
ncbi:uncharacterized [Tachysurus ichikawai]